MEYMKFNQKYFCGVDLHAKTNFICIMDYKSRILVHRRIPAEPRVFFNIIEPYKEDLVVGTESTFNWYWLADLCHDNNIPFALGHALYMKAIHGGKKKNDKIDSKTIADLMRSGMFPPAYSYPKRLRATRDLLRRRHRFVAQRAELYRHIKMTFYQHGLKPPKLNDIKNNTFRSKIITEIPDPDIQFSLSADHQMIQSLNAIVKPIEKQIYVQAKCHNQKHFKILTSIPGCGQMSAFNIIYETDIIDRFPKVQNFSSYCRVVKCKHESAGKTYPNKNNKIGNPYLKWTMSEIAVHAIEFSPAIKKYYNKLLKRFSPGKAKSVLSHKMAIAIYFMLKNQTVFDEHKFVN